MEEARCAICSTPGFGRSTSDQFRVGVVQSLQEAKLPFAEAEILITPGAVPVFFKNLSMLFFKGVDHSGRMEQ